MDSKDAHESLESGSDARCRFGNGRRRGTAMLVIHSLITAAFAAFTLYTFLKQSTAHDLRKDKGIYMQMSNSDELSFSVIWNQNVELKDGKRMNVSCGGPYMLYMWACIQSDSSEVYNLTFIHGGDEILQKQLEKGCQGMQSVLMLSDRKEITLEIEPKESIYDIKKLTLGLHYMLGDQCFPSEGF